MSFAAARSLTGPRVRPSGGGASRLAARGAGWGPGRAGGAAVVLRGASAGGLAGSVRGIACRWGGGGGGGTRATVTRALGSGDAPVDGGGGASIQDKLAARRAARGKRPGQAGGEGGRAAGGAVRGGRGGGGGGRGGRGAGGGKGLSAAIALNRLISQAEDPEGLLRLVADELPNFDDVNVSTAFSKLGRLCGSRSFPRNIAADHRFRGLMVSLRDLCADGQLQAQAVANITHAVSKMSAAGKLATDDAGVQGTLAALEQRVVRVASDMKPQEVSNTAYGFALVGWDPGAEARAALEAAVVRVAPDPDMVPQNVSNVLWALATLGWEPGAEARAALEAAVVREARGMKPQELANTAWSFATLGLMPGAEVWAALKAAVVRVGPGMDAQAVANMTWSFATLGLMPGAVARAALEAAVVRVGPDMNAQAVSNITWSFATLGLIPGAAAWAALEAAVVRVGPRMDAQAVANIAWSCATLGLMPRAAAWAALEAAVVRVGPSMIAQAVANTAWSFATLGLMPGAEAWAALEAAVVRVGPGMNAQNVSNTLWSVATLGLMPGAEAWAALEAAVVRVARDMKPQAVANSVFGFLTLAATRGAPLPACYPFLWRVACGFEQQSFKPVEMSMLFQAYLIHTELVKSDVLDEVTFPPWIMHEAREAWMRQAQEEVKMGWWPKEIASILGDLGIPHEVERLTDDGYFSVDVYLPGNDIALELDGPTHFIASAGEGGASGDKPCTTRTPRSEIRDMFLARRHRVVLSVPWFEFDKLRGRAEKSEYVAAKLRAAGVSIPAAT